MTAIATVPALLRLARVTPYLLAVAAALAAWLLLGTDAAFASERSATSAARVQKETAAVHETLRAHQPQPETEAAAASQKAPAGPPPTTALITDHPAHHRSAADRATVPGTTEREYSPRRGNPQHSRRPRDEEQPVSAQPSSQPAAGPNLAPQPAPSAACTPRAHEGQQPLAAGLVKHSTRSFARQPGIALVASPSEALAPNLPVGPPAVGLPAPGLLLPVNPPMPIQPSPRPPAGSAAPPAHQATVYGSQLAARLESGLTLVALGLLIPLLGIVLLFQIRLMRQIRLLTAAPVQPATRYYSLTLDEVRELAPDMLPALAHHRFCETDRHQGRWRPASWIELEETDSELPLMWATCETCHHRRMTRLKTGREVGVSPQ